MAAAATTRRAATAPAKPRKRPTLVTAPARKPAPARRPGGQLIPIAVGTATAVRGLPDSSLIVRLTRGRAWIAVLGALLAGIVALNVVTLSIAATVGHVDRNLQALDEENSMLRYRDAQRSGIERIRSDAAILGLSAAAVDQVGAVEAGPHDVETAAQRLAAAETAY